MCGIYGNFRFKGELDINQSFSALRRLDHRGPDGFGFEFGRIGDRVGGIQHNSVPPSLGSESADYFLGHTRLSIVDLSEGAFQPMESACGRYSVSFNGEIYNYIELWQELLALGCDFKTDHSDTEVILNAYRTWGPDCVTRFRGMFGFAILDRQEWTLFLARDRIGQKTIYFEATENSFQFASELPPIVRYDGKRHINADALNLYLVLGYIPYPHSIYRGIQKLPPATYVLVDLHENKVRQVEYWDLDSSIDNSIGNSQAVDLTKSVLRESVSLRMRADVSMGAFISGGTDSTLVVKYISEAGEGKLDIYGADFPGTDRSEKEYIVQAAQKYDQNLKLSELDLAHTKNIRDIVNVFDEPFDGASSIALFDLFKDASKDHKIILTGDGGDEMFAGYTRYLRYPNRAFTLAMLRRLILPKLVFGLLARIGLLPERLKSLKALLDGNSISNFTGLDSDLEFAALLKDEYRRDDLQKDIHHTALVNKVGNKRLSPTKRLQYLELKTILPGRMLYKLDRFSMFYGVEARSPFLDHRLAELAYRLPDNVTINNGVAKAVLKKILSEDFDDEFVHRTKKGFGSPLSKWFREGDEEYIFAVLSDRGSTIFNFLDFEATFNLVNSLKRSTEGPKQKKLWRLLVLAHYFENYRDIIAVPA